MFSLEAFATAALREVAPRLGADEIQQPLPGLTLSDIKRTDVEEFAARRLQFGDEENRIIEHWQILATCILESDVDLSPENVLLLFLKANIGLSVNLDHPALVLLVMQLVVELSNFFDFYQAPDSHTALVVHSTTPSPLPSKLAALQFELMD